MGITILDAYRKMGENDARRAALEERHSALIDRWESEDAQSFRCRSEVNDGVMVPLTLAFSRLENVDVVDLPVAELPEVEKLPLSEPVRAGIGVTELLRAATGAFATSAGTPVTAYHSVRMLATASTGAPISGLSGAAAENSTLARLGGGSRAVGGLGMRGGTAILGGLSAAGVAVSTMCLVSVYGRREQRRQMDVGAELDAENIRFTEVEVRTATVLACSRQVREVLRELAVVVTGRLPALAALIDRADDGRAYTAAERAEIATMVDLGIAIALLIAAPLEDESGAPSDVVREALAFAVARLPRLDGDRTI